MFYQLCFVVMLAFVASAQALEKLVATTQADAKARDAIVKDQSTKPQSTLEKSQTMQEQRAARAAKLREDAQLLRMMATMQGFGKPTMHQLGMIPESRNWKAQHAISAARLEAQAAELGY